MASFPSKWQHWAIAAGSATALAGIVYYLLRDDPLEVEQKKEAGEKQKVDINKVTKEKVLSILDDIIKSQEKMKVVMKSLTQELVKNTSATFDEVYDKVKLLQPEDPLEKCDLSMNDFDNLLDRYQYDPSIRDSIGRIMGAPGSLNMSAKCSSIKREKIVEVHEFMLKELQKLVDEFQSNPRKSEFDMKTVTIAAQALVGARVESTYDLTSDDIESAVLLHHQSLASDAEFARINVSMQSTMSDLMGAQFPSNFL